MNMMLTATSVGVLLLYAIPGWLLAKFKMVSSDVLPAFTKVLLYVCQPCLCLYTFNNVQFTWALGREMLVFLLMITLVQAVMLGIFYLVFRKKQEEVRYRIYTTATTFSNCMFFGVPILNSLLPNTDAVVFSNMYFVSMSLLGWTLGCAIITHDMKYISLKKIFFNPSMITTIIVLPLFIFSVKLPINLYQPVELMGKMTTPLSMLIMGIRLGGMSFKRVFSGKMQYLMIALNQFIFPLLTLAATQLVWWWDDYIRQTMFILSCCPVASMILNFAELVGEGQEEAANVFLLGTMFSIITMPLMLLLI